MAIGGNHRKFQAIRQLFAILGEPRATRRENMADHLLGVNARLRDNHRRGGPLETHIVEIAGTDTAALRECHHIRHEVFCAEQGVAEALEWDGLDTTCRHFLIFADGVAAGTARLRPYKPGLAKIERVAVLKRFRGLGLGRRLMVQLIAQARNGHQEAILNAQTAVRDFYAALGFAAEGPEFEEANIPHVHMRLKLR